MNVLLPITDPQELLFIPRFNAQTVNTELTNEETDLSVSFELIPVYANGFMTVEIAHNFKEGEQYQYEVTDLTGKLMYRGKIFITDQTELQEYKTNPDFLYA